MRTDIDRMNEYTGTIDGRAPGQPYERQWWYRYFEVEIRQCVFARFKTNIFTRTTYIFRANCKPFGNR